MLIVGMSVACLFYDSKSMIVLIMDSLDCNSKIKIIHWWTSGQGVKDVERGRGAEPSERERSAATCEHRILFSNRSYMRTRLLRKPIHIWIGREVAQECVQAIAPRMMLAHRGST